MTNPYTKLARTAVEEFLKSGKIISPPKNLPAKITKKAGVFVSIHEKKNDKLRGCIGTFLPTTKNIATEIITNAIKSASQDPRFLPVKLTELPQLYFSVYTLSKPKNVAKVNGLDTEKDGLIVFASSGRRALLLPGIPQVKTPEEQLRICCLKASVSPEEKVSLQTFAVEKHEEKH